MQIVLSSILTIIRYKRKVIVPPPPWNDHFFCALISQKAHGNSSIPCASPIRFFIKFLFLHHPSNGKDRSVLCIADFDPCFLGAGMYDHATADVHSNMSIIADNVSRLCTCQGYFCSHRAKLPGCSGHFIPKVCIYSENKSRAVRTVGQAGASRNIRVSDKLASIVCHCFSGRTATGSCYDGLCCSYSRSC